MSRSVRPARLSRRQFLVSCTGAGIASLLSSCADVDHPTTQLYFTQELNDRVRMTAEPYRARGAAVRKML